MCRVCTIVAFFFFFKQKTAYEMRISDWSSDVCSSDLIAVPKLGTSCLLDRPLSRAMTTVGQMSDQHVQFAPRSSTEAVEEGLALAPKFDADGLVKIGRQSCRARECPSV